MATVEHCLYCFEVLAAELERRSPLTFYQVTSLWSEYPKGLEDGEKADGDASEEEEDEREGYDPQPASELETVEDKPKTKKPKLNPALARLAGTANSGSNTTTGSSTPASASDSSTSLATNSTSTSTSTSTPASSSYASEAEPSGSSSTLQRPSIFRPIGIAPRSSQHASNLTESPLFVTWNKISGYHTTPRLRGCIGTFESQPLAQGLASYSLTSALGDTRFNPVVLSELPKLEVAVTLLTDFETCADPMDWELGVHGLKVSFYYHHKRYGATYLPDVAVEQGWTKEETLLSLMRKAGWLGRRERWREVGDLKVVRYQGKKESVDYEEYRRWREWVDRERNGAK
jgi:uncharacterized protein (TIGR00296 family)